MSAEAAGEAGITAFGCGPQEAALFQEMAPRYGVVPTVTDAGVSLANLELAAGNRCISVGHQHLVTDAVLLALREAGVRCVVTRSVGCNHIDVDYARSVGVAVETVAYSPGSVAEYTLMLMLMALRHAKSTLSRAQTHDYRLSDAPGRELRDMTVGVIGTGRIGAAVVDRLKGFGCRLLAYDRRPKTSAEHTTLDELLRRSDIVTLHTPLTGDTQHLLNRRRIEAMRQGALIVNTGRGALIDTDALVDALESGHLGGAALDVVEGEGGVFYTDHRRLPLGDHPLARLQRLPNVLITPHTAYYTDRALRDMVEATLLNCLRIERRATWVA